MHVKLLQKKGFVENVWPANLALFIYVSTHCIETVKWLDFNRYSQLTRWCRGNASALCARGPGFNPRLRQGYFVWFFLFIVVVFLLFWPKTHNLPEKFAIPFTMLIYLNCPHTYLATLLRPYCDLATTQDAAQSPWTQQGRREVEARNPRTHKVADRRRIFWTCTKQSKKLCILAESWLGPWESP